MRILGTLLVPVIGLLCYLYPFGGSLRRLSYDLPFLIYKNPPPPEIVMVYLDEKSAADLNQSLKETWDRSLHTRLLERLTNDGARLVYYDIVFSAPSANPAVDAGFAAAIRKQGSVVLGAAFDVKEADPGAYAESIVAPTEELRTAAAGWGIQLFYPVDPENAIRRLCTGVQDYPTASWVAAMRLGAPLPSDQAGRLAPRWLNYYGPVDTFPSFSFSQALLPDGVPPGYFKNKIVLIGGRPDTGGLALAHDEFSNPWSRRLGTAAPDSRGSGFFIPGLEIHATELANLLHGAWLVEMPDRAQIVLLALLGLVIGLLSNCISPSRGIAANALVAAVVACAACWSVWERHLWFDWLVPVAVMAPFGCVWSSVTQYFFEAKRRSALRRAFSLYLSPHMADRISASDFSLKPGGKLVDVTVLFTDCKNFTGISEELGDPLKLSDLLIEYFTKTSRCILENDGTILKYIGDAVMAAWNAPLADADHAYRGAMAAWQLQEASQVMVMGRVLTTRIGVCTGPAVAGNLGSPFRFDYTMIGETTNIASRLEGMNKILDTGILISDSTCRALNGRFVTRFAGNFAVAGKSQGVFVHELIGPASAENGEHGWIKTFHDALEAIRDRNFEDAVVHLRKTIRERNGKDGPSEFYIKKIAELEKSGELHSWTGLVKLSEK